MQRYAHYHIDTIIVNEITRRARLLKTKINPRPGSRKSKALNLLVEPRIKNFATAISRLPVAVTFRRFIFPLRRCDLRSDGIFSDRPTRNAHVTIV